MVYLKDSQLAQLTDEQLANYATKMMDEQLRILDMIDVWTDFYNLAADEFLKRRLTKSVMVRTDSEVKH